MCKGPASPSPPPLHLFFPLEGQFKECGAVSRGYKWKAVGNVGRN